MAILPHLHWWYRDIFSILWRPHKILRPGFGSHWEDRNHILSIKMPSILPINYSVRPQSLLSRIIYAWEKSQRNNGSGKTNQDSPIANFPGDTHLLFSLHSLLHFNLHALVPAAMKKHQMELIRWTGESLWGRQIGLSFSTSPGPSRIQATLSLILRHIRRSPGMHTTTSTTSVLKSS